MVAMETGWTPDVLAELPDPFRRACHWRVYARAIAGDDGLPNVEIPRGASSAVKLAAMTQRAQLDRLRRVLYPEGKDG